MAETANAPGDIARIVFREILDGDRLKFIAQANQSQSGGGARDLRFRSWDVMEVPLRFLFPVSRTVSRKRGAASQLDVFVGQFNWKKGGKDFSKEAVLEPPTDARANEGRITRVHEYDCFTISQPAAGSGRLMVIFVQKNDETVWPFVITERSLEHDKWHASVKDFLLSALNGNRRSGNAAYGYIDFKSGKKFFK
jgi:hypothetical protein